MLSLHNLGIGKLQLGADLDTVGPVELFNEKDGKYLIPIPDRQSWYRYNENDILIWGNGKSFAARSVYLAVDGNKQLRKLSVFPDPQKADKIESILIGVYGNPRLLNSGGFGSLTGMGSYDFKIWVPGDKMMQITFFNPSSSVFGLAEIAMFFALETEDFKKYKLLFRSWEQPEGL